MIVDEVSPFFDVVTHEIGFARNVGSRAIFMDRGVIVEQGPVAEVFNNPRHPYTKALISAAPIPDPAIERGRTRILLNGDLPSPTQEISGCRFRTRCPIAETISGTITLRRRRAASRSMKTASPSTEAASRGIMTIPPFCSSAKISVMSVSPSCRQRRTR